jgi:hypothetical protein
MFSVRLRRIEEASFNCSEKTLFMNLTNKVRNDLKGNDAVCFVSKGGNQMLFVWRQAGEILASVRLRLLHGTWDPLMLQNYANEVGLELEGLPRFEIYFTNRARARAAA